MRSKAGNVAFLIMLILLAASAGSVFAVSSQSVGYSSVSVMLVDTRTWTGYCAPLSQSTGVGNVILPRDTTGSVAFRRFGWVSGTVDAGESLHCDRTWDDPSDSNVHWYHADYLARCGNPADITFYVRGVPAEAVIKYVDREVERKIICLREVERTVTQKSCVTNNYYTSMATIPASMPVVTPMATYGGMRYPGSYSSGPPVVLVGLSRSSWQTTRRQESRVCPPPVVPPKTCDTTGPKPPPSTGNAGSGVDPGTGGGSNEHTTPPNVGPLPPPTTGQGGGSPGGDDMVHLAQQR